MDIYEIPGALNESRTRHLGTVCGYSPQGDLTSALFMSIVDLHEEDQFRYLCVAEGGVVQAIVGRENDRIDVVPTEEALARDADFQAELTSAWEEAQRRHAQYLLFQRIGGAATSDDLKRLLTEPAAAPTAQGTRTDN